MQETDSQSQEQATATKVASAPAKSRTLWGDAFKRLRKNKLAVIGVCWIIIVVVVALTADLWAKPWLGSPTASDSTTMAETSLLAPCAEHPFGTDALGRDILVRVIYGARVSLSVGIIGHRHLHIDRPGHGRPGRFLRRHLGYDHHALCGHLPGVPVRAVRCRHDRRYRPWSSERLYRHRHSWLAFDCARLPLCNLDGQGKRLC